MDDLCQGASRRTHALLLSAILLGSTNPGHAATPSDPGSSSVVRTVSLHASPFKRTTTNTVALRIQAQGDENALGCSLQFDPSRLGFIRAEMAPGITNATLIVNTNAAKSGLLVIAAALKTGTTLPRGDRDYLLLTFQSKTESEGATLMFRNRPQPPELVSVKAERLPARFMDLREAKKP